MSKDFQDFKTARDRKRPKQDPIFDFDWRTDGWLLLGFVLFALFVALTV